MSNQLVNDKIAYSIPEAASAIGISVCLAYSLCRKGVIPTIKLGERRLVVPKAALEKWLNEATHVR